MVSGVVNLNKPSGPTSHDVVERVRRAFSQRRVGHAGTLDPRAEGVLVVLLGQATRLSEYAIGADKTYRFDLVFGVETDSLDLDGRIVREMPTCGVTEEALITATQELTGEIEMPIPLVSAISRGGRRLYHRARANEEIEVELRKTIVYSLEFQGMNNDEHGRPIVRFTVECGKGTYVRSLGREIAAACGTVASVDRLVRIRSGQFTLDAAVSLDTLEKCCAEGRAAELLLDPDAVIRDLPAVYLTDQKQVQALSSGQAVVIEPDNPENLPRGEVRVYTSQRRFFAVGEARAGKGGISVHPKKILFDLRSRAGRDIERECRSSTD